MNKPFNSPFQNNYRGGRGRGRGRVRGRGRSRGRGRYRGGRGCGRGGYNNNNDNNYRNNNNRNNNNASNDKNKYMDPNKVKSFQYPWYKAGYCEKCSQWGHGKYVCDWIHIDKWKSLREGYMNSRPRDTPAYNNANNSNQIIVIAYKNSYSQSN